MKVNDSGFFRPAMDVIRSADPSLYADMVKADWPVYVFDDLVEMAESIVSVVPGRPMVAQVQALAMADSMADAFGVTNSRVLQRRMEREQGRDKSDPLLDPLFDHTWISRFNINREAANIGVDPVVFAAAVIVHEFAHINGKEENGAYAASSAFARKLRNSTLADYSDVTGLQQETIASLAKIRDLMTAGQGDAW
jgi:hypothetical protein